MARGDFSHPVTATSRDEVGELARTQARDAPGSEDGVRQLVIEHQGHPVGDFGVRVTDPGRQVELGIVVHPDFQGRRLASLT